MAEAGEDTLGNFAALEFVAVVDVRFVPVPAEASGDAVFVMGPAGVVQQDRSWKNRRRHGGVSYW